MEEQLLKSHQYYNKLVEIGRHRRQEYRRIRSKYPGFAALEDERERLEKEIKALRTSIKSSKSESRSRKVEFRDMNMSSSVDVSAGRPQSKLGWRSSET